MDSIKECVIKNRVSIAEEERADEIGIRLCASSNRENLPDL